MALPTSAAFKAAQVAPSAEPRYSLLAILTDVAESAQGATVVATDEFGSDFPAAGAIDGKLTHLNFGPAATAEDLVGKAGWKSASAAMSLVRTTAADWTAGTQSNVRTFGAHSELLMRGLLYTGAWYSQNFDGLANGDLVGQDSWAKLGSHINPAMLRVQAIVVLQGTKSLQVETTSAGTIMNYRRTLASAESVYDKVFRFQASATVGVVNVQLNDSDTGPNNGFFWRFTGASGIDFFTGGGGSAALGALDLLPHIYRATRDYFGIIRAYIDGVLVFTSTATPIGPMDRLRISASDTLGVGTQIHGYLDEFILSKPGPAYEQDFNGLTNGALATQDGWVQVSGAGLIDVVDTGLPAGMEGKALRWTGTAGRRISKLFNATGGVAGMLTFKRNRTVLGTPGVPANTYFRLILRDSVAAVDRYEIRATAEGTGALYAGVAGAPIRIQTGKDQEIGITRRTVIDWSSAAVGATVRFWIDGNEADEQIITMTGVDTAVFEIVRGAGGADPVLWIEEFRIGDSLATEGTQDNDLDWGAVPASARAEITMNAEVPAVSRYAAGGFYGVQNNDASRALRRTSAPIGLLLAQTFEVSSLSQIDSTLVMLIRTSPAPDGNVWLELRDTSAGAPTAPVLARSQVVLCSSLPTATTGDPTLFIWPKPWVLQSARRYALVLNGDYDQSNTINVSLRVDASAPGYATGQVYDTADGTTWAAQTEDAGFIVFQTHQIQAFYDLANRDGSRTLGGSASGYVIGQSLKVPRDRDIQHFQFLIRKHESASFAAGTRFRIEMHGDDGTGKSNGIVLARGVEYDPASITWGGTEGAQVFELFTASLSRTYRVLVGTSYVVVLIPDWAASGTNHLDIGTDESSATYPDGVLSVGTSAATPVWTVQAGKDLIFALLTMLSPTPSIEIAYSSDGISFGAFQRISDNPGRTSTIGPVSFTGQALRYWRVRARLRRVTASGVDRPIPTAVFDYTVKIVFGSSKSLTVAFGQARTVSRVEIIAHPLEAGVRSCKLQTSPNGTTFSDVPSYARAEARKRGGGATATAVGAIVTTDGDYIALDLASDVTGITHLRLIVLDNLDEWARVIELRAFRAVDFGRRVLGDPSVVGQADFVQRRFRAKHLAVQLDNTDGFLSPLGTSGGFNSELGEGVRLIFRTGYQGTEELLHGEFWVDNWPEDPERRTIAVQARDLAKLADVSVTTRYKTDKRSWELIEYLMNLANIPSQWLTLDRTSTRIKHFAPTEPNAWQESQKIAEAASFAQLYVDRDGYLRFRASGLSCGDAGIESASGLSSPFWLLGAPTFHEDGNIYIILADNTASGELTIRLMKYVPSTGVWTAATTIFVYPSISNFEGQLWSGDGYLWIMVRTVVANPGRLSLYRWDGVALVKVSDNAGRILGTGGRTNPVSYVERGVGYIGSREPSGASPGPLTRLLAIDHLTYRVTEIVPDWGAAVTTHGVDAILSEGGKRLMVCGHRFTSETVGIEPLGVHEWNPHSSVFTRVLQLDATVQASAGGVAGTGLGYLYLINEHRFVTVSDLVARMRRVTVPGYAVTDLDRLANISRNGTGEGGHLAYVDGIAVAAHLQTPSSFDFGTERRLAIHDEDTGRSISAGTLTMAASQARSFVPFSSSGQNFIMGVYDRTKVFEMQVRRSTPLQAVPVITVSDASGGLMLGSSLDHGTDKGGDNRIVNVGIFKSQPLIDLPPETLWNADRLPWRATINSRLRFKVQLKDPGISLAGSITTSPGGAATITLDDGAATPDAIQPTVLITVTADCFITALSITGRPLRKAGTLVVGVVGHGKSLSRFGVRPHTVQNDYVYDTFSAAPGASWLVLNNQARKTKVDGLSAMALFDLELLDLIRLVDSRTGLDQLFYVTGFRHGHGSQRSSLTVVQRIGAL